MSAPSAASSALIGGLGGFVLPILFGVLNDLTGIWQSCFMLLFGHHGGRARVDALRDPPDGARSRGRDLAKKLPELPEMQPIHKPQHENALGAHVIEDWRPEDPTFWKTKGRAIAQRNLWISIPSLLLSFAVWMVWSVVVAKLPLVGFNYTTDQLFWLAALPGLSGAALRVFYSFMVPIFGGRLWTTLTTWSLIVPALGIGFAVQDPETPYVVFLMLALLCGFGGGNFASSMGNISFFFPKAEKGNALALNAGLGNLGVSVVQFLVPRRHHRRRLRLARRRSASRDRADGAQTQMWLQNAGFIWVPFIIASRLRRLVRHERHRLGESLVRRAIRDLPAQAQLDHVLALHRHLRLVHRLLGGASRCSRRLAVPARSTRWRSPSWGRSSARCRAR